MFSDVLIDTVGVLFGLTAVCALSFLRKEPQ